MRLDGVLGVIASDFATFWYWQPPKIAPRSIWELAKPLKYLKLENAKVHCVGNFHLLQPAGLKSGDRDSIGENNLGDSRLFS